MADENTSCNSGNSSSVWLKSWQPVRTTETAQTCYTVQILDDYTATWIIHLHISLLSSEFTIFIHLSYAIQPLTDKSRRKVQSTENFIDAIKTVQIPDDYKLVFWCEITVHQYSSFNWLYRVRRPLSNNLPLNYRYRQKTSWTYRTFALHRLTFSTTVNTKSNSSLGDLT